MDKTALVTGVTGQDGSYLSELLLERGYRVIGLHRRNSTNNFQRILHIINHPLFTLEEFDLTDPSGCLQIISHYQPDEFYNLAAQSHVGTSFAQPTTTFQINTLGVINILDAIRHSSPETKFYQASTSEMFGSNYSIDDANNKYQDENTPFIPQSPYGVAKLASHRLVQIYRNAYNIFGCCGILFNHESPRRGENFVTRKITKYIGQVINHQTNEALKLGNLNAKRDWGHAKDYVNAMHLMLQDDTPRDYVICTGKTWTILDFLQRSFSYAGLDYTKYVEIDQNLYRPAEVDYLCGRNDLARKALGWEQSFSFDDLVQDMVDSDIKAFANA
jgi:GDPmannose 4,6-dehydratase